MCEVGSFGVDVAWMTRDTSKRAYNRSRASGASTWSFQSGADRWRNGSRPSPAPASEGFCRQQILGHLSSLSSVVDRTSESQTLFPGVAIDLLFECEEQIKASQLFPSDFSVAVLPEDPPVSSGYLVIDLRPCLADAGETLQRLSSTWWELTQASSLLVTLVFVTTLPTGGGTSERELCTEFALQHRYFAYQAPAPLVFAAWWEEGAGGSEEEEDEDGNGDWWEEDDWWEASEENLYQDIADFLEDGPHEVQELAAKFASRFNESVRMNPKSGYNPDKKNDGSFKKWLVARGLQMSDVYERNKCMASLPADSSKAPEEKSSKGSKGSGKTAEKKGGKGSKGSTLELKAVECDPFDPPFGVGTEEARQMEIEATQHVLSNGPIDMGALREVNQLGMRFNNCFWQKSKVNNGSWKKWLASLPELEVCVDPNPKRAAFHGNQATMVRAKPKT